uniref:Uncharacterized protein n=1 Tax=Arundo donax TaxID=35708 RepID=A0A0A9EQZ4_ARUDO
MYHEKHHFMSLLKEVNLSISPDSSLGTLQNHQCVATHLKGGCL